MAKRPKQSQTSASGPSTEAAQAHAPRALDAPVFAQPEPTADPSIFKTKHPSDGPAYKVIDELNKEHRVQPMPFPPPRADGAEPQLTLAQVFGSNSSGVDV
ncbi:MAG: metallophosphoesterase, partial [Tepidisphaerales bacterium]